eukprot:10076578-Alexandrium_andersonii.AAC.1
MSFSASQRPSPHRPLSSALRPTASIASGGKSRARGSGIGSLASRVAVLGPSRGLSRGLFWSGVRRICQQ